MPSLFASLFKYRASEKYPPKENFFTEALAGVLNTSDALGVAFVYWLIGREVKPVRVETQKDIAPFGQVDMWLKAKDDAGGEYLIVLENKIDAQAGKNQLKNYENYLKEQVSTGSRTLVYLIYLTRHNPSNFHRSDKEPVIEFQEYRWFEVYDWLEKWTPEHDRSTDRHPAPLVNELLALMEDWNMDMNLSANDLTAATTYKLTTHPRLIEILEAVKSKFGNGRSESNWRRARTKLFYESPYLDERKIYFAFGFDFEREDDVWSVSRLGFPSAYFGVWGQDVGQIDQHRLSDEWVTHPGYLDWGNNHRVRRLNLIEAHGASLRSVYLDFFLDALGEVQKAMNG